MWLHWNAHSKVSCWLVLLTTLSFFPVKFSNPSICIGSSYQFLLEMRQVILISLSLDAKHSGSQKKTADTLIADNPSGFIPDEITRLLEKTFIWSVSFTESTIDSGNVTFQVNAVVGEINDGSATIPATPDGSQASSLMLSGGAGTSIQNTPQKSHALTLSSLPATSEPSLASSATPAKQTFPASEPPETPQSVRSNAHDKVNYSLLLYMLP